MHMLPEPRHDVRAQHLPQLPGGAPLDHQVDVQGEYLQVGNVFHPPSEAKQVVCRVLDINGKTHIVGGVMPCS